MEVRVYRTLGTAKHDPVGARLRDQAAMPFGERRQPWRTTHIIVIRQISKSVYRLGAYCQHRIACSTPEIAACGPVPERTPGCEAFYADVFLVWVSGRLLQALRAPPGKSFSQRHRSGSTTQRFRRRCSGGQQSAGLRSHSGRAQPEECHWVADLLCPLSFDDQAPARNGQISCCRRSDQFRAKG